MRNRKEITDINGARRFIVAWENTIIRMCVEVEQREKIESQKRRGYQV